MKKIFFCIFAVATLLTSGCSKDDVSPATSAEVSLGGKTYSISDVQWGDVEWNGVKSFSISSNNELNKECNLFVSISEKKVADVAINSKNSVNVTIGADKYYSTSGTITITVADSKHINGSFSGKFTKGLWGTETVDLKGAFVSNYLTY
jgi:hypothetical protein